MSIWRATFPSSAPGPAWKEATVAPPRCRAMGSGQGSGTNLSHTVLAVSLAPMWRSAPGHATHIAKCQWWVPTPDLKGEERVKPPVSKDGTRCPCQTRAHVEDEKLQRKTRDKPSR